MTYFSYICLAAMIFTCVSRPVARVRGVRSNSSNPHWLWKQETLHRNNQKCRHHQMRLSDSKCIKVRLRPEFRHLHHWGSLAGSMRATLWPGCRVEMGIEPNPNQTHGTRTLFSVKTNRTEPKLKFLGSIPICNVESNPLWKSLGIGA